MGYHRAGFDVVGIDIKPQPRYPFEFHQRDALEYLAAHGREFDAIHASPPCPYYAKTKILWNNQHPDLIGNTRQALQATGKPYVIENVPGAPLINPVTLTGTMFGLRTMRPRLFECSFTVPFELAPPMPARQVKMGRQPKEGEFIQVVGNFIDAVYGRRAMGIDWMTRRELAQAIPPAYCEFIGKYLIEHLRAALAQAPAFCCPGCGRPDDVPLDRLYVCPACGWDEGDDRDA